MKFKSIRELISELQWPIVGTTIERINKFIFEASKLEERLPGIDDPLKRAKFNKTLFRIIPKAFGLEDDQADLPHFKELSKVQQFMIEREWNVKEEDNQAAVRINAVSEEVNKVEPEQDVLSQALVVIKESQRQTLETVNKRLNNQVRSNNQADPGMNSYFNCFYSKSKSKPRMYQFWWFW